MWFNNVLLFHYELEEPVDINQALQEAALKACPPHARFMYGWLPVSEDLYAKELAGTTLICMGKEERILPKSVIFRELEERVAAKEAQLQSRITRAERAQMAEEIEFEFLPRAFCLQKRTMAILDQMEKRLIINTASQTQALQVNALLRKSIPGIRITPLKAIDNLAYRFSEWINQPGSIPPAFDLASDCLLFAPEDEKKKFNCKGYALPADEILTLLTKGLLPAEISLQWSEHIQFTLTHEFTLKRIKCLDFLVNEFQNLNHLEDEAQQFDAALVLLTQELRQLVNALLKSLSKENTPKKSVIPEPA